MDVVGLARMVAWTLTGIVVGSVFVLTLVGVAALTGLTSLVVALIRGAAPVVRTVAAREAVDQLVQRPVEGGPVRYVESGPVPPGTAYQARLKQLRPARHGRAT